MRPYVVLAIAVCAAVGLGAGAWARVDLCDDNETVESALAEAQQPRARHHPRRGPGPADPRRGEAKQAKTASLLAYTTAGEHHWEVINKLSTSY